MKFAILAAALSVTSAFAQSSMSPAQLCQRIASVNGNNGALCAQLISRNRFDPAAIEMASVALSSQGSNKAMEVLNLAANRRLEPAAGQMCEAVMRVNASNSIECLKILLDTIPSPEVLRISQKLLSANGSSSAISALQAGAGAYFFAPLMEVCEAMVNVNATNAVVCIQTIANKVSMNGSEQICRTSLNQGSSYALRCLQGVVMDYTPVPQSSAVMVELYRLQDLRRSLLKAKSQLNRGMIEQAERTLEDASSSVDAMLNGQPL